MAFHLRDADKFFENRMKIHPIPNLLIIWVATIRQSETPVKAYISIMDDIKKNVGSNANMTHLPDNLDKIKELWNLRECIIALSFITADAIMNLPQDSIKIGDNQRRNLFHDNAQALIMGSTTLLSDIDVTILSPNASTHIAIIEDLWEYTGWFNHNSWKVDLYGDFTMIGEYYLDTRFLTTEQKIQVLVLAVASYYRHTQSAKFDTEILHNIIDWCIEKTNLDIDLLHIVQSAKEIVADLKYADREIYYKQLRKAELLKTKILEQFSTNDTSDKLGSLLGKCIVLEGLANLHREENYILVPTVIHVVKVEQGKDNIMTQCKPLRIRVARCSLSSFVYSLSAIEQLGYMQENLVLEKTCNMAAGKYFGRLLRALNESVFDNTNILKDSLILADELAKEKKHRGNAGIKNASCEPDLLGLIAMAFSQLLKVSSYK
jgi:hypothetical protein